MSKIIDLKLFEKEISSSKNETLMEIKKRALDKLKKTGIPNKSHENWKYTDIARSSDICIFPILVRFIWYTGFF